MFGKLVGEISHKKPAVKSSQPRDTDVVKLIIEENWALKQQLGKETSMSNTRRLPENTKKLHRMIHDLRKEISTLLSLPEEEDKRVTEQDFTDLKILYERNKIKFSAGDELRVLKAIYLQDRPVIRLYREVYYQSLAKKAMKQAHQLFQKNKSGMNSEELQLTEEIDELTAINQQQAEQISEMQIEKEHFVRTENPELSLAKEEIQKLNEILSDLRIENEKLVAYNEKSSSNSAGQQEIEHLTANLQELQLENDQLTANAAPMEQKLLLAQEEIQRLCEDLSKLASQDPKTENNNTTPNDDLLHQQVAAYQTENEQLTCQNFDIQVKMDQLTESLQESQLKIEEMTAKLQETEQQSLKAQREIGRLAEETTTLTMNLAQKNEELENVNVTAPKCEDGSVDDQKVNTEIEQLTAQLEVYQTENENLIEQQSEVQLKMEQLTGTAEEGKKEIEEMTAKLHETAKLHLKAASMQVEKEELLGQAQGEIERLAEETKNLTEMLAQKNEDLSLLKIEMEKMGADSTTKNDIEKHLAAHKTENEQLTCQNIDNQVKVDQLTESLQQSQLKVEEMTAETEHLQLSLSQAQAESDRLAEETNTLTDILAQKNEDLSLLRIEMEKTASDSTAKNEIEKQLAAFKTENERLTVETNDLTETLAQKNEDLSLLKIEIEQKATDSKTENERLPEDQSEMHIEKEKLTESLQQSQLKVEEMTAETEHLQLSLSQAQAESDRLAEETNTLTELLAQKNEDLSLLRIEMEKTGADSAAKHELETENERLTEEQSQMHGEKEKLTEEIQQLTTENEELIAQVSEKQATIDQLSGTVEESQSEVEKLNAKLGENVEVFKTPAESTKEHEIEQFQTEISLKTEQIQEMQTTIDELNEAVEANQLEIEYLTASLHETEQNAAPQAEQEEELLKAQGEIERLQADSESVLEILAQKNEDLSLLRLNNQKMTTLISDLQAENDQLQEQLKQGKKDDPQSDHSDERDQIIQQTQLENKMLKNNYSNSQKLHQSLSARLQATQEQLNQKADVEVKLGDTASNLRTQLQELKNEWQSQLEKCDFSSQFESLVQKIENMPKSANKDDLGKEFLAKDEEIAELESKLDLEKMKYEMATQSAETDAEKVEEMEMVLKKTQLEHSDMEQKLQKSMEKCNFQEEIIEDGEDTLKELEQARSDLESEKEKTEEKAAQLRKNKVDHLKATKASKEEIEVLEYQLKEAKENLLSESAHFREQINALEDELSQANEKLLEESNQQAASDEKINTLERLVQQLDREKSRKELIPQLECTPSTVFSGMLTGQDDDQEVPLSYQSVEYIDNKKVKKVRVANKSKEYNEMVSELESIEVEECCEDDTAVVSVTDNEDLLSALSVKDDVYKDISPTLQQVESSPPQINDDEIVITIGAEFDHLQQSVNSKDSAQFGGGAESISYDDEESHPSFDQMEVGIQKVSEFDSIKTNRYVKTIVATSEKLRESASWPDPNNLDKKSSKIENILARIKQQEKKIIQEQKIDADLLRIDDDSRASPSEHYHSQQEMSSCKSTPKQGSQQTHVSFAKQGLSINGSDFENHNDLEGISHVEVEQEMQSQTSNFHENYLQTEQEQEYSYYGQEQQQDGESVTHVLSDGSGEAPMENYCEENQGNSQQSYGQEQYQDDSEQIEDENLANYCEDNQGNSQDSYIQAEEEDDAPESDFIDETSSDPEQSEMNGQQFVQNEQSPDQVQQVMSAVVDEVVVDESKFMCKEGHVMEEVDGMVEKLDQICDTSSCCKNSEMNWFRCKPCDIKVCYYCTHCPIDHLLSLQPDRGFDCVNGCDSQANYWQCEQCFECEMAICEECMAMVEKEQ